MIILYNAKLYTQEPCSSNATALAIEGEKILAVGSDDEILDAFGKGSNTINLDGSYILPGLVDSHLHLAYLSRSLNSVNCETDTLQECLDNVAERVRNLRETQSWIEGHGWNHNVWENGAYGNVLQLDAVSGKHPVLLHAKSLHAAWANSRALQFAGIDAQTPDPPGGEILRFPSGEPNGILLESAVTLVSEKIPDPSPAALAQDLAKVQAYLWQMGLTGVHDFDGPDTFEALQILQNEGRLQLRVRKNLPVKTLPSLAEIGLRSGFGNPMLHLGSLKMFADGALGPQSAAMLEPYEGSGSKGFLLLTREEIFETGRQAVENGWSLSIHAIGDLANRSVLDGLADLRQFESDHKLPRLRHRIEHVQLIDPHDQNRLSELDITASMQPIHCASDMFIVDKYWGKRGAQAYIFNTLKTAGTHLVFGSDAPVESPNPFFGLHAAVTRRNQAGHPDKDGWYREQKISLREALDGYTREPAYLSGMDTTLGKINPGYLADLIVLKQDIFKLDADELFTLSPDMTIVNGRIVFQN